MNDVNVISQEIEISTIKIPSHVLRMQSPGPHSTLVRHQLGWKFCAGYRSNFFVFLVPESAVKGFAINQGELSRVDVPLGHCHASY